MGEQILPAAGGSAIARLPAPELTDARAAGRPAFITPWLTVFVADVSAIGVVMMLGLVQAGQLERWLPSAGAQAGVAAGLLLLRTRGRRRRACGGSSWTPLAR